MSQQTSVRYTARDAATAEENQRLIDRVFADLASMQPQGLTYRVSRSEDDLSFEHVAVVKHEPNPLLTIDSSKPSSTGINQRVVNPPAVRTGEVVARCP